MTLDKSFGICGSQFHQIRVCVCVCQREKGGGGGRARVGEERMYHITSITLVTPLPALCGVVTGHVAQDPIWKPEKYNLLGSMELPT